MLRSNLIILTLLLSLASLACLADSVQAQENRLSPEEIIARHLQSLGSSDQINKAKKRMAIGGSEFIIRLRSATAVGRAVLASDGQNMAFFSTFNMSDYKMERIGIFSDKIDIPFVIPGRRSPLGSWLTAYDRTINDRIFGGTVFSTWLFSREKSEWGKMETEGKKKIGDREAWVVSYTPTKSLKAGSFIRLYFDTETFRHLRTVYRQTETENGFYDTGTRGSNKGSTGRDWDASMASNSSTLTEDFEEYRKEGGLVLPHKYGIKLSVDSAAGTSEFKWDFSIEEYRIADNFPPNFFSFSNNIQP